MTAVGNSFPRGNSVLDFLPETERRAIFSAAQIVDFAPEETVYHYGEPVGHVYFPVTSIFSTISLMEDGSSAEISLTGSDGAVGIFAVFSEQATRYWTSVLVPGSAVKIEIGLLRKMIFESEILRAALLESYRNLMAQITQRAVCNGRHSLAERFCFWLLLANDRAKTNEIALTHEIIARKLGARRAGVTNVAGNLQSGEIIAYSRGSIKILNRPLLEKNSCECYHTIQNVLVTGKQNGKHLL